MSDRITMLMLKALRRLDPDEQDEVLESLLAARLGADAPPPRYPSPWRQIAPLASYVSLASTPPG